MALSYAPDDADQPHDATRLLQSQDAPVLHIQIDQPLELLTESLLWEAALILASVRVQWNPFHLAETASRAPSTMPYSMEAAAERTPPPFAYADGVTRQEISALNLAEALRSYLCTWTPARHVTFLVALPQEPEIVSRFAAPRTLLSQALHRFHT